jgi:hypothetical protein
MSELVKEFSTKLKSFQLLAYIILLFSVAYIINDFNPNDKESLSISISIGLLGLFASGFLFYFGQKKRTIKLYNDKIEYVKSGIEYSADWKDVILVKSFKEIDRKTENLIIMTQDENIFSISTAFFDRDKLIACFNEIIKINSNRNNFTVEDDRDWRTI